MRPIMQKQPQHKDRELLDLCRGSPCTLNFPCCTGGEGPEAPSVPCHSNSLSDGRGYAHKTHDHTAVPGCPSCHHALDYGPYTREQKEETFRLAQRRWWAHLWNNQLIKVA